MGSLDNTVKTIFELAEATKSGGFLVLNAGDRRVWDNCGQVYRSKDVEWYGSDSVKGIFTVKNYRFHEDGSGISFDLFEKQKLVLRIELTSFGENMSLGTLWLRQ